MPTPPLPPYIRALALNTPTMLLASGALLGRFTGARKRAGRVTLKQSNKFNAGDRAHEKRPRRAPLAHICFEDHIRHKLKTPLLASLSSRYNITLHSCRLRKSLLSFEILAAAVAATIESRPAS